MAPFYSLSSSITNHILRNSSPPVAFFAIEKGPPIPGGPKNQHGISVVVSILSAAAVSSWLPAMMQVSFRAAI